MCGISGIIHFDNEPINLLSIKKMNANQRHRGPDGLGLIQMGQVAFGHNRLSIIDLDGGSQPFVDAASGSMITYNGEVYNYKELREELGDFFKTTSDTEVVLRAYLKWGSECIKRFNGMFSFAIFDKGNNKVFIARDRFGIKPLYYFHTSKKFLFASELYPLMSSGEIPKEIFLDALKEFFQYQCVPAPLSIYKNVFKLEPGHYIEIDLNTNKFFKQRYWSLESTTQNRSIGNWLEDLNSALDEAIHMQCRSDVPFGSFLSGGVDSSLVSALMQKHMDEPVRSFSIGFEDLVHCELPYARQASAAINTYHHEKIINPVDALKILNILSIHFGEPFADSSAIPTYYVSKEAAKKVKMVLSGDGGDEVFAGYDSYVQTSQDICKPCWGLLQYFFKLAAMMTPSLTPFLSKLKQAAKRRSHTHEERHNAQRELFSINELQQLLCNVSDSSKLHFKAADDLVTSFQLQDIHTYLVDDVLTKVDRMSMANSLEVRVPLLDHRLVELAFSMPIGLKLKQLPHSSEIVTKYILKLSASRFFDFNFLNRKKAGFGIPIQRWCVGPFREIITNNLMEKHNPIYGWVDFGYVQRLLNELFIHNKPVASKVWSILQFDLWMRNVHNRFLGLLEK